MTTSTLDLRARNRATLARQMLLARERTSAARAIERLVAMQAQWPRPPFVGLWSRVQGFRRDALLRLLASRRVVRATCFRGTLHVMTAKDFLALRGVVQPALEASARTTIGARLRGVEAAPVLAHARRFFARPRTFEDFRAALERESGKHDIRALAYLARLGVPMVQAPEAHPWGFPAAPAFVTARAWLGREPASSDEGTLLERYLAAYGPAGPQDFQTWSGLPGPTARAAFTRLAPRLVEFRDERGKPLFDLRKAPRPDGDVEAPVRFLPEFDHLVLAHADRTRFVPAAHRAAVFLPGLRVAQTFLVDGFVAGLWHLEQKASDATLVIEPFARPAAAVKEALLAEGRGLLAFLEPGASRREVRFAR